MQPCLNLNPLRRLGFLILVYCISWGCAGESCAGESCAGESCAGESCAGKSCAGKSCVELSLNRYLRLSCHSGPEWRVDPLYRRRGIVCTDCSLAATHSTFITSVSNSAISISSRYRTVLSGAQWTPLSHDFRPAIFHYCNRDIFSFTWHSAMNGDTLKQRQDLTLCSFKRFFIE